MESKELISNFCNDKYVAEEFVAVLKQHVEDIDAALSKLTEDGFIKQEGDKIHVLKH